MISSFIKPETRRSFADIFEGKFELAVKSMDEHPDARQRVNKAGKTVFGVVVGSLCGRIADVDCTENEYGAKLLVTLAVGGDELLIRMPFDSAQAFGVLNVLPRIDFSADVELIARPGDGKGRAALFVKQGGQVLKHAFTRENPNGRPDWVPHTMGDGRVVYDKSAQTAFFKSLIEETRGKISAALNDCPPAPVPNVPAPKTPVAASLKMHADAAAMDAPAHIVGEYEDDLPF